jgi:SAM-dependent methyltransferase
MKGDIKIIEETGKRYNEIIFDKDYIPNNVYMYQINLRDNIIHKCVENRKFKYAIDLGCGTGFHLKTLSRYSENLIGTDMSLGALKECKKNVNIDCNYIVSDIKRLPFKNNIINFIWISGVLHHVPNDLPAVIFSISQILKNDGLLLIDEPNKLNFFNNINMKLSKADPTGKERPISLNNIERLLETNNFIVLESDFYEFFSPIGIVLKNDIILNLLVLLDEYIHKTFFKFIQLRWYVLAHLSHHE